MIFFTIQYTNALLFLLSLALILPARAASTGSGIARSSRNKRSTGFRILPDDLTPDFFKRQTVCSATSPLCGTDCCATTCCSGTCCSAGTTCTAGVCTSTAPPPATTAVPPPATTAVPPPATTAVPPPASPSDSPPASASSAVQSPSSSPSVPVVSPPPTDPSPSSSQSDVLISPSSSSSQSNAFISPSSSSSQSNAFISPSSSSSQSDALISPSSSQLIPLVQTPLPSGSSQSGSSIQSSSSSSSSQSDSLIQTPLPSGSSSISSPGGSGGSNVTDTALPAPSESIGNGTISTSLSDAVVTGGSTIAGGSITLSPQATPLGNLSQNDTSSSASIPSSTSYALSYEFATVTGPGGSESISIGTVAVSQAVVPLYTDPAVAAAPLVVQQALADTPPTPVCQLQYLPGNAWQTTGGSGENTTSTNGPTPHQGPEIVPQCNNGTRVSNKVGSEINLKFTGTEVYLLMVPGVMGGAYDVKIDDEDVDTLDNYKADTTSCVVATPWNRTGLENKPHDITVIVKGAPAGSAGGSQIEFNGLIFKGPKTTPDSSGPNWIIIGASIGAGVVVLALIFIGVLCIRRRRAQRATPTPVPRPASTVSSFRPQTLVSNHARTGSAFSGAGAGAAQAGAGHHRADSNFSNAPSGHYRGDSGFSGAPYSPASPLSQLQQNPYGHSRQQSDSQNPFGHSRQQSDAQNPFGHSHQQSDAPLMMQQGPQTPWQIPTTGVANVPPSGSPYHSNMSSPQSRPLTFVGYNNGQERQSMAGSVQERQPFVQTHGRATSHGSDTRNPFE